MNHNTFSGDGSLLPNAVAAVDWSALWGNVIGFANTYPLFVCGVLVVLLLLLLVLTLRRRCAQRGIRVYQEDGGFAVVSQKALRHLIHIACEDAGLASSPRIQFKKVKGRINVVIGLKLFQSQRLSDVHELLRERIRVAVEETHGIEVGEVSLQVLGFRKDPYRREQAGEQEEVSGVESGLYRAVPGEASAASLYEESAAEDLADADPSEQASAEDFEETGEDTPKKRRFGLFGRKKDAADEGSLFVTKAEDESLPFAMDSEAPSVAEAEPQSGEATAQEDEKDRA